jgi:hypothetical protein
MTIGERLCAIHVTNELSPIFDAWREDTILQILLF